MRTITPIAPTVRHAWCSRGRSGSSRASSSRTARPPTRASRASAPVPSATTSARPGAGRAEARRPEGEAAGRAGAETPQAVTLSDPASAPGRGPPRSGALAFRSPSLRPPGMRYRLNLLLAVLTVPVAAQRQQPDARGGGVAAITAEDVRRCIGIIAADSMLGRATPSPQLDQVAAYVAAEV